MISPVTKQKNYGNLVKLVFALARVMVSVGVVFFTCTSFYL